MLASYWMDVAASTNPVPIQSASASRALLRHFDAWIASDMLCSARNVLYQLITSIPCIVLRYETIFLMYDSTTTKLITTSCRRNGKFLSFAQFLFEIWVFVFNWDTDMVNIAPSVREGIRIL